MENLQHFPMQALPACLTSLSSRNEQLGNIIQSIEANYLAVQNDSRQRREVEQKVVNLIIEIISCFSN